MPLSMSPRTQAMQPGGVPSDQAKSMFDQGLSSMAYTVLINKLPNISQDVVTFKVLDSDPDSGSGVGAFVVMRNGQTFYIPVVMAGNQIKPLDILYYKDLNVFLPLTKEWMEQLDKLSLGSMGKGVVAPKTMSSDVDIRNTVVPPTTGRYSYAEAVNHALDVFTEARNQEQSVAKFAFLDFMKKAPGRTKKAVAGMFEIRPGLLKMAVRNYGVSKLTEALRFEEEKTASAGTNDYLGKLTPSGALYIADATTTPQEFKRIFGEKAPLAFQGVKTKSYYVKDDRKTLKRPTVVQPYMDLKEPKDSGVYRLFKNDGTPVTAFVISHPICPVHGRQCEVPPRNIRFRDRADAPADPFEGHGTRYRVPGITGKNEHIFVDRYVGVTENGKGFDVDKLMGEEVSFDLLTNSPVYKKLVADQAAAGPRRGQRGIFVQKYASSFVGTTMMEIEEVSESGGVRRIKAYSGCGVKTLVTDLKSPISKIHIDKHSDIVYLPQTFIWLPATSGQMSQHDFMLRPKDIENFVLTGLHQQGAEKLAVAKPIGNGRGYVFRGREYDYVSALRKIAVDAQIAVPDAEAALKIAEVEGKCEFYTLDEKQSRGLESYLKIAEGAPPSGGGSSSGGSSKSKQPQSDPAQDAMNQVMMAQAQQPQGPQPVDMAVAEQMQLLQGQQVAIQQQMQMLQNLQNRANMIAGSGGAQGNPAAAAAAMGGPMDPSQMGAGMPMGADPSQMAGQQPGMQQGGSPPMGGQPQQGAPSQMGGQPQQPGMPQQGGQPGQPGQDPNAQQQQPPQAMMNSDDGSVESLMQQVNPQFMEQAGQLQDHGTFDAAALASMAQTPSLKDLVSSYLPNLERSLDNLGRVLLTLWMDEDKIKESLGTETYISIEDNLRTVFKGMGDLILKVNQNTLILRDPNESKYQE